MKTCVLRTFFRSRQVMSCPLCVVFHFVTAVQKLFVCCFANLITCVPEEYKNHHHDWFVIAQNHPKHLRDTHMSTWDMLKLNQLTSLISLYKI